MLRDDNASGAVKLTEQMADSCRSSHRVVYRCDGISRRIAHLGAAGIRPSRTVPLPSGINPVDYSHQPIGTRAC